MLDIYKASAGSGKTFTLAYRYIKMMLGRKVQGKEEYRPDTRTRDRHRRLLAITFTNKATDEMKRRIVHELAVMAGCEPSRSDGGPYMERLTRELNTTPDVIAAEARRALNELLYDYSGFSVSTIDSFFQSILRTFAREAELTGDFELELEDSVAATAAIAETFRSLSDKESGRTLNYLTRMLLSRARKGEAVNLFNRNASLYKELLRFMATMSSETFSARAAEMNDYFEHPERLDAFIEALNGAVEEAHRRMADACRGALPLLDKYASQVSANVANPIAKFATLRPGMRPSGSPSKTTVAAADDPHACFKKAHASLGDTPDGRAIADASQAIVDYCRRLDILGPVIANIHYMGIAAIATRNIDNFRRENNMLLLSDTNALLRRIIGNTDTPFIYERMGLWIDHYLIDEFQDTSMMQWQNLRPLLAEGLGTGKDSLIIGDEKQCIYRFRNSAPELLTHGVAADMPGQTVTLGNTPAENTNWRSSATVVAFNNMLFGELSQALGFDDIYGNVAQQISPAHASHQGYIDVARVEGEDEALERMTENIRRQLRSGYRPCDIAVLARGNAEAVTAINTLMQLIATDPDFKGIRVISDDSIAIGSSPAVRQVICTMREMHIDRLDAESLDENDRRRELNHTLTADMRARLFNRYEHYLAAGDQPNDSLRRAILDMREGRRDDVGSLIGEDLWQMRCPNLTTLVSRIIDTVVSPSDYTDQQVYLAAFIDLVNDYSARGGGDLKSFLDWWDSKGRRRPVGSPQDDNAMRVMTIHKSKGLEFKCVHIPFADWKIVRFGGPEWFATPELEGIDPSLVPPLVAVTPSSKMEGTPFESHYQRRVREQLLDELNVAYVAFTRAIDELIVSHTKGANKGDTLDDLLTDILGEHYTDGEPTTAPPAHSSLPTAVDPKESVPVSATRPSAIRRNLWDDLRIETDRLPSTPRGRGILIHDILASIDGREDSHTAVRKAVRHIVRRGLITPSVGEELTAQIEQLITSPEAERWFVGYKRAMAERPIASGVIDSYGNAVRKRPDRIVWTADGHIDIIDYKTGEERPAQYNRQVRQYMHWLATMGYTNIRGYLWYLDTGVIRQVP